jgi:enamine deaminase RidA (YjgF/YER057c/UK114 family)
MTTMKTETKGAVTKVYSGGPFEAKVAYSRATRVGDHVFVAGTTAVGDDGAIVGEGDLHAQSRFVFRKIAAALEACGASLRHVVRTRTYVTDITQFDAFARAHREAFEGIDPVATCVEVRALVHPAMLVEIDVDAIVTP